jgi:hypothetical protein
VERQKILVAQAAEAVAALRAMLADPQLFEDAVFRRLMLRATRPIVDRKRSLQLHERLMSCLVGVRLSDDFTTFPDRAGLLREAHELLDAIEVTGESG